MLTMSIRTTGKVRTALAAKAIRFQVYDWETLTVLEFLRRCAS